MLSMGHGDDRDTRTSHVLWLNFSYRLAHTYMYMYVHLLDVPKQPTCMNGGYGELYQQLLTPSWRARSTAHKIKNACEIIAHVTPTILVFSPRVEGDRVRLYKMWSIDSVLAPTSLTPPPSPAWLPGTTPTRRGYGSMRVRVCPYTMPYELERKTPWSRENCDPNTAPPTLLSPLNSTMPPQSVPVASMPRFASPLIGYGIRQNSADVYTIRPETDEEQQRLGNGGLQDVD